MKTSPTTYKTMDTVDQLKMSKAARQPEERNEQVPKRRLQPEQRAEAMHSPTTRWLSCRSSRGHNHQRYEAKHLRALLFLPKWNKKGVKEQQWRRRRDMHRCLNSPPRQTPTQRRKKWKRSTSAARPAAPAGAARLSGTWTVRLSAGPSAEPDGEALPPFLFSTFYLLKSRAGEELVSFSFHGMEGGGG